MLRLLTVLALLGLGAGGGIALAAVVGTPPDKAAALARLASVATTDSNTEPAPAPPSDPHPIPGRILASDAPAPISPAVLEPSNGWLVSDGRTLVAVYAGAAGGDPSVGRVVVVRQDLAAGTQTVRTVEPERPEPSRSRPHRSAPRWRRRPRRGASVSGRPTAACSRSTSGPERSAAGEAAHLM